MIGISYLLWDDRLPSLRYPALVLMFASENACVSCMLGHDVDLPCLYYVIYTRNSLGYRTYAKSSNFEPVL